jgi:hypothetical protein
MLLGAGGDEPDRRGETASPPPSPIIGDAKDGRYMTFLRQSLSFYAHASADWVQGDAIGFAWVLRWSLPTRRQHCGFQRAASARIVEIIEEFTVGDGWVSLVTA